MAEDLTKRADEEARKRFEKIGEEANLGVGDQESDTARG
jgi:hypothetical protein